MRPLRKRRRGLTVLPGGIAQLGERLHGMQEVSGSIPLTSTIQGGVVDVVKDKVPFV